MRQMTVRAVFDAFFAAVCIMPAAFFAKKIKRAIAEKAVKVIVVRHGVARKKFTFTIIEKSVIILHNYVIGL